MEARATVVIFFACIIISGTILIPSTKANLIVMWNGTQASIPAGWACDSCGTGFYRAIPRISTTFCGFDGDAYCYGVLSHSHTMSLATTIGDSWVTGTTGVVNTANTAASGHVHTGLNATTTNSTSSIPPAEKLIFIKWNSTNSPQQLITGMIVLYNSTTAPTNFSLYTTGDGYFPYGESTSIGATLGQETHAHQNKTIRTTGPSSLAVATPGIKVTEPTTTHFHNIGSIGGDNQSIIPLYVNMTPIIVTQNTSIPIGMIGMFNSTPSGNWSVWTSNLGYYVRMSTSSFNVTGGNANHTHTLQQVTTGAGSASIDILTGTNNHSGSIHKHLANISFSIVNNAPSATNTIFAISNGSQQIITTTCTWSGIGNWLINCNDNCNLTTTQNLMKNAIILSNVGILNVFADILNISYVKQPTGCSIRIAQGKIFG